MMDMLSILQYLFISCTSIKLKKWMKLFFFLSTIPALSDANSTHVSPTQNGIRETGTGSGRKHVVWFVQINKPLMSCSWVLNIIEIDLV